jgi:hypothetical protein
MPRKLIDYGLKPIHVINGKRVTREEVIKHIIELNKKRAIVRESAKR